MTARIEQVVTSGPVTVEDDVFTVETNTWIIGDDEAVIEWSGLNNMDHDPFHSFMGSEEIRLALAAKIIEAHGGSAKAAQDRFIVKLPLSG